jgi:hypothetical protein
MDIPANTLKEIIALRKENGLDASEAAAKADLAKVKYQLEETPRYRKAGRSPLFLPGKMLTSKGIDPVTGEKEAEGGKKTKLSSGGNRVGNGRSAVGTQAVDETAFYKVLHGKGFAIKMSQDLLTGELDTQVPAAIKKLDLRFGAIPSNADGVHITQTSPQIQISLPLDKFLELTGIKP